MKHIFVLLLSIGFINSANAENICHKKPVGECEDCCQKSNEARFREAAQKSCARIKGEFNIQKAPINSEATAYTIATASRSGESDPALFKNYLLQYCSTKTGTIELAAIEMNFADCAKGCPPPKKKEKHK